MSTRARSALAEHIGQQILKARQKLQWSMEKACIECGISKAFFCDMENGKTTPGADTLLKLSKGFGVSVNHFFKGFGD